MILFRSCTKFSLSHPAVQHNFITINFIPLGINLYIFLEAYKLSQNNNGEISYVYFENLFAL